MVAFAERTKPCPVILYPAETRGFGNWCFADSIGTSWTATGTAPPTRTTTGGEYYRGTGGAKFNPGLGQTSYLTQTRTMAQAPDYKITGNLEPFVVSLWGKQTVGTGVDYVTVTLKTQTAAAATVETLLNAVQVPLSSSFARYWITATPTTYASVDRLYLEVGFKTATAAAATAFIDSIYVGHEFAFQDATPGSSGAFVHSLKWSNQYSRAMNVAVDGTVTSGVRNAGLAEAEFGTSVFDGTTRTSWLKFFDYCSDKTAFTFHENQLDTWTAPTINPRGFIQSAVMTQDSDGLKQVRGTAYHEASLKMQEVRY
jgi:hypothetical protein